MHDYYQKLICRGADKPSALIAVSKKLIIIIFTLVRRKTNYDRDYLKLKPAA